MKSNHLIDKPFSKTRSLLWPIHSYELKKFMPMFLLFLFISLNYSILRTVKDGLIFDSAKTPGAEIIPYLKFWGVTPIAIIFMIAYSKLSNILSKPALFYSVITFFLMFFAMFALFLHPNKHLLHPESLTIAFLPQGATEIIRLWSFSLFYIFSELWGSIALSLLFWQFANQTTRLSESKRFYTLFGIGANVALIISGIMINYVENIAKHRMLEREASMRFSVNNFSLVFVLSSICIMGIYWWINRYILTDTRFYDQSLPKKKSQKLKMSFTDSIKMVLNSKYLICIALLVICYGISINLIEVTWKGSIKQLYPGTEYMAYMGKVNSYTGLCTILMMLFVSGNVLRRFGWTVAAQITPVVLLIFGFAFFNLIIFKESFQPLFDSVGVNILGVAVLFGAIQNIISKSSKYSLFDPTKEMLYIPLDEEAKVKGKAAIDVIGARLGKAGGSVIQQVLVGIGGSMGIMMPFFEMIFIAVMVVWILSAAKLGRSFNKATSLPTDAAACPSN